MLLLLLLFSPLLSPLRSDPIYVYYSVLWCYEMSSHFSVKINVWITHNPPSLCVSFSLQIKRPAHPCVRHRRAQVSFQYTVCNCDEIDVNKRWIRMCFIFFVQTSSKKEKWEKNQLSTASKLKLHSELASVVACKSEYFCKYINCPTKKKRQPLYRCGDKEKRFNWLHPIARNIKLLSDGAAVQPAVEAKQSHRWWRIFGSMNTLGNRGEREKNAKPKFASLDINNLYRTSRVSEPYTSTVVCECVECSRVSF